MLHKPLKEEQADMKTRWSDPSYQWANDSNLRRKFDRHQQGIPQSVQGSGCEVKPEHKKKEKAANDKK